MNTNTKNRLRARLAYPFRWVRVAVEAWVFTLDAPNKRRLNRVRALLGTRTLMTGLALLASQPVLGAIWPRQDFDDLALVFGILLLIVGLGLGVRRLVRHLVEQEGWHIWVRPSRRSSDDWMDQSRRSDEELFASYRTNPAYDWRMENIFYNDHH